MNFSKKLKTWQELINNRLDQTLPAAHVQPEQLHLAIRHSMSAGGKRLRPILVMAAHEIFPGDFDPVPAALAIECIHTYSLIHDDLPAMDDSDLRRGKASCHKAFDEATAILAGDALQPLAFEILSSAANDFCLITEEQAYDAVRIAGEMGLATSPSGAAGLAALLANSDKDASSLVFFTEGSVN